MTPAETLAKSRQLDGFLGKAVREIKTMNKFAELASKVKANQEAMNAEADDLSTDADRTMSLFMASAGRYRTMLGEAKAGIKAMEEAALAMAGGNGGPLPDSPPASQPSPPVIEPPVVVAETAPDPAPDKLAADAPVIIPQLANSWPATTMDPTATGNPPA